MTLELTVRNVNAVWIDCLGHPDDPGVVEVDAIIQPAYLKVAKIEDHAQDIVDLLLDLPHEFRMSGGGGWSFLQACVRHSDGQQWGEHPDMAKLFAMGMAAGFVECQLPRGIWDKLPGGMPYYVILDKEDKVVIPNGE